MELLILCNQNDAIATALYKKLSNLGDSIYLVTAEELVFAPSWHHELNEKGKGSTRIKLQNGKVIDSKKLKSVWNRIRFFPMPHFKNENDQSYAQNEMFALYISFLKSINSLLINPLETIDLAIEEENLLFQKMMALNAGLPVLDHHFSSSPKWSNSKNLIPVALYKRSLSSFQKKSPYLVWQNQPVLFVEAATEIKSVWVVGKEIFGNEVVGHEAALKKLSRSLKKMFLEISFAKTAEGYKLSFINSFPLMAPDPIIDTLASLLTQKASKL
jgi:hypothetical protein